MLLSSCKNLAGILRQETSRSEGSGVVCVLEVEDEDEDEVEVEALFEDWVRAGSSQIPCAWLATGDKVKKRNEAAAIKCGRAKKSIIGGQFPPEPSRPDWENCIGCFYRFDDAIAQKVRRRRKLKARRHSMDVG
jgi:hypothetical protein